MAKKRGNQSPLGNAVGAQQAQQNAAKSNLESLTKQLSSELEKVGGNTTEFLASYFGIESVSQSIEWTLASGTKALFNEVTLSHVQVKEDTVVTFHVNGRDQSLLTKESLEDLNSLEFQQFYPAVGRQVDGKIDVLDGSRRRAWFLLQEGRIKEFRILVTNDDISMVDAKALAKQLQTAKEHNLREIGMQCVALQKANQEITQAEIAQQVGLSQSGVSKAIKAANINEKLIQLFPVVNALYHPDYALLDKVMKVCDESKLLNNFITKISKKIVNIQAEYSIQDQKDAIVFAIKSELKLAEAKKEKADIEVTTLAEFYSKGMFARKKVKGRNFSYEFGRLSKEVQAELDHVIREVLRKK
ncbi:ParB family protein [Aliivibrio fischeri]|uniref:Chromosome partitioning protein ParB n=1 Tax=Aliivibrio fischeri TaxID=668 RepID=A0A510UN70_ALIFS|nr:ParB family protein [Aliivibrio fischeri]MUK51237.1 ParB/RepB/Spo0J family partition protein [Aliivibrio fischeri]GEK16029.1 chromosome partitioning protein ParB [Aliivibrio fischeri]